MGTQRTFDRWIGSLWLACAMAACASGCVFKPVDLGPPLDSPGDIPDQPVIVIPADWRQQPVFRERFATEESARTIELAAMRFLPTTLSGPGGREFGGPAVGSFAPELLRDAFTDVDDDMFIVQARTTADLAQLRLTIESLGTLHGYLPHNAYLVRLTPEQYDLLVQAPSVGWLGFYQPAWRVSPKLDYLIEYTEPRDLRVTALFDPAVYATTEQVTAALASSGFSVVSITRRSHDWKVRLTGSTVDVGNLVTTRGCTWVERFAEYVLHNNVARSSGATTTGRGGVSGPIMDIEDVWSRGIRGEGQIASAADTGLSTGDYATLHADFGELDSSTNPLRVIAAYARGRVDVWNDDQDDGGGHGTHTSGSIVGNGIRSGADPSTNSFPSSSFAGAAPKAQFVFQSILDGNGGLGGLPADLNDLFRETYLDGARVHSNSWGSALAGEYSTDSQDVDEFTWLRKDMVITFSAGNSGVDGTAWNGSTCQATGDPIDGVIDSDSIGAPATAKNCITVGATENYRPSFVYEYGNGDCTSDDDIWQRTWGWFSSCYTFDPVDTDLMADNASGLGAFSSRGPTDDNRFKPDVVAPGIAIISTRTDLNQAYEQWGICNVPASQRSYYLTMGGTSMANPLTAGAATLVRQYYADGWHANGSRRTNTVATGADLFNPSSALVKATLINGAWGMAPGQYGTGTTQEIPPSWDTGADVPNNAEGFGRVDVEASLFPGSGYGHDSGRKMQVDDVTAGLRTGERRNFSVTVASNADPLIITLVWTDPYAASGAGIKLVNDLDLTATAPGGTTYYPNGVDRTSGVDNRNTVEQIKVTSPETGVWDVQVYATAVPGNAVDLTDAQPFALVTSGVLDPLCTTPSAPTLLTAAPGGSTQINLSWSPVFANSYRVHRATATGGPYTQIASGLTSPAYNDTVGLSGGVTYYYVVTAFNEVECESSSSNELAAVATGSCGELPGFAGLQTVDAAAGGGCTLRLEWSAGTNNCGSPPLVYNVYRATSSGFTPAAGNRIATCVSGTSWDDTAVADGTTYYYVVRAEDHVSGQGGSCRGGSEESNLEEESGAAQGPLVATSVYSHDFETGSGLDGWGTGYFNTSDSSAIEWQGIQDCRFDGQRRGIFRFGASNCNGPYTPNKFQYAHPAAGTGLAVAPGSANTTLSFTHTWDFETNWDGGFLALSFDASNYVMLPKSIITGTTYNGTIASGTRDAFSGTNSTFVQSVVDLDAGCDIVSGETDGCAGRTLYIAFTASTDGSRNATGWFVDDVAVTADSPGTCNATASPVQFLTATAKNGQNILEWKNPTGTYDSTMIRFRTDTFPTSATDGAQVIDQAGDGAGFNDTTTDGGLSNGTTYYYSAFVNNGSGTFSSRQTVASRPFSTTGAVKWAYATGASAMAPPGIGSIYAASNDRILHSITPGATGGTWPSGWTPFDMNGASQGRPVVVPISVGGATKVVFVSSQDGRAYAVNAASGSELWMSPLLGDMLLASPAAIFQQYSGAHDLILIGTRNTTSANQFRALSPFDGTVSWSFTNGGGGTGIGIISGTASVSYADTRVYFTSRARSGGSADTAWCLSFDAGSATKVWSVNVGSSDSGPALANGALYVGNNNGEVYALNPASGATLWSAPYTTTDGTVKGTVWVSGTNLIFSTANTVWSIVDNGSSASLDWSLGSIPSPSMPLVVPGTQTALVGSSDGRLYQIDFSGASPTTASVLLGDGGAAIGSPSLDVSQDLIHVGSEAGIIYAVTYPLP